MTPADRLAALATLGWSIRRYAAECGCAESSVRDWQTGRRTPPPALDAWLAMVAARAQNMRRTIQALQEAVQTHEAAITALVAANPPPVRV